jgi:hypothetical protein
VTAAYDELRPVAGAGLLARHGALVLLLSAPPGAEELVGALLAAHDEVARSGGDGDALTQRLGAVLGESSDTVDLVAFGPAAAGHVIVVFGHAFADVATAEGTQRIDRHAPRDGVRSETAGRLVSVRAGLGARTDEARPDRFGRLAEGVVPAGGFVLTGAEGAAAAQVAEAAEVADAAVAAAPAVPNTTPPAAGAPPAPAARTPAGVMVLDTGATYVLDRDHVIGRDPDLDPDVRNGVARGVALADPYGQLSRVHLRVHLEGDGVEIIDLGSANGTGVWRPGDTQWTRVPPNTRIPIRPGTQVGFGHNQLRLDPYGGS